MWNLSAAATIIIAVAADDGTGRRMVAAAATIATVAYSRGDTATTMAAVVAVDRGT